MRTSLLLLLLSTVACAASSGFEPGETFEMRAGDIARVPACGMTLRLVEVRNDSRCPVDTNCVWAGDAEIVLQVERGTGTQTVILHANPASAEEGAGGCGLAVVDLRPAPHSGRQIAPEEYVVSLVAREPL